MSFHSPSEVNNHACEEDQLSRNAAFLPLSHSWAWKQIPHFLESAEAPQTFHKSLCLSHTLAQMSLSVATLALIKSPISSVISI